jgi:hypothetical protein
MPPDPTDAQVTILKEIRAALVSSDILATKFDDRISRLESSLSEIREKYIQQEKWALQQTISLAQIEKNIEESKDEAKEQAKENRVFRRQIITGLIVATIGFSLTQLAAHLDRERRQNARSQKMVRVENIVVDRRIGGGIDSSTIGSGNRQSIS